MKKLAWLLATTPFIASAGLFRLTYTGGNLTANQARPILDLMETEVNKNLPSADSSEEYFKGMSTANSMSAAGVTSSYGTVFRHYLVGITASGGAHLGSKNFTDFGDITKDPEQLRGFGTQAALVFGVNVGRLFGSEGGAFDLSKFKVYLSGFALNKKFGDADTDYFGLGAAAQYRLIDERNWGGRSVKWTGLDIGVGLLYSKLDVNAVVNLNKTYTTTSGGSSYSGVFTGSALFNANVKTITMPIEASTGIRFLYFLKFIAGIGADVNLGNTSGNGTLSSNSLSVNQDGGPGGDEITSTANLDLQGDEGADFMNLRVFVGPHIEFGVGSLFVNLHKSLLENAIAVNAGVNFFW